MCATPFPGTILYDQLKEKDAILPGGWDKFSFNNYCIRGELSPDEIYRFINNTLRKFYLRPLYIISRLKNFRNPRKAVNLMTYGLKRSMEIKNAFTNNT
jgi:radical SAM superfamily enzyme YgiQ (UPF0313 family)